MAYRNVRLLLPLLLGAVVAAGVASGQDPSESGANEAKPGLSRSTVSAILRESDRNGDGQLQREEAPILILSDFDDIDRDHDNRIDSFEAWEYDARRRRAAQSTRSGASRASPSTNAPQTVRTLVELVERADADGDGKLSQAEMPESLRERFVRVDLDGDGFLELEEAAKLDSQARAGAGRARRRTMVREVGLMDTDGDGLLQKKEAPMRVQRIFETLDRDRNGAIDLDEAKAADAAAR